jgi:hypothetical protein
MTGEYCWLHAKRISEARYLPFRDSSGDHCPLYTGTWVLTRKTVQAEHALHRWNGALYILHATVSPAAHEHPPTACSMKPAYRVSHPADTRHMALGGA